MTAVVPSPWRIAADLIAAHGWDTPVGALGKCGQATYALQRALPGAGSVRVWTDYDIGPDPFGHRRAEHNAAWWRGQVWDLTAVQFGEQWAGECVWDLDEWVETAAGWLQPADYDLVVAEVLSTDDRLRRSWRVPIWEWQ